MVWNDSNPKALSSNAQRPVINYSRTRFPVPQCSSIPTPVFLTLSVGSPRTITHSLSTDCCWIRCCYHFFVFLSGAPFVAQVGFELTVILLPPFFQYREYGQESRHPICTDCFILFFVVLKVFCSFKLITQHSWSDLFTPLLRQPGQLHA